MKNLDDYFDIEDETERCYNLFLRLFNLNILNTLKFPENYKDDSKGHFALSKYTWTERNFFPVLKFIDKQNHKGLLLKNFNQGGDNLVIMESLPGSKLLKCIQLGITSTSVSDVFTLNAYLANYYKKCHERAIEKGLL